MVPAAELRVYQPLEAFPPDEQARWERHILAGAPRPIRARYADVATPAGLGFLVPSGEERAHVKVVDGAYFVCPERTRLRTLAGLLAFSDASPFESSEAFLRPGAVRRARRELARLRRREPGLISAIMQSPWHVPVRWFVLFNDDERRLVETDEGYRLSYLSTTRKAARRIERAVPALRNTDLGPIADLVIELHRWLLAFDPGSLVELDYGGLSRLMSWDEMDDDHSARDIHEALRALAAQEFARSAELYQSALARSAELRNHESTN
jgi:hypothetical protein